MPIPVLNIPFLEESLSSDYQEIREKLRLSGVTVPVDKINWADYPYQPFVQVTCAYSKMYLWLLFEVKKDYFRSKAVADQDSVWEDSCVEFFFSGERVGSEIRQGTKDAVYRNFEFNVSGVCLSACGTIFERKFLEPNEMCQILRFPGMVNHEMPQEGSEFDWELGVAIPLALLGVKAGDSFCANFYKCGDLTSKPHFLSWKEISSEEPDFHLPDFFGEAVLFV
jgi:hypothetical protein